MSSVTALKVKYNLTNRIEVNPHPVYPSHSVQIAAIKSLYNHHGAKPFSRKCFRPNHVSSMALPYTNLVDIEPDGKDIAFRFRLFSTELYDIIGTNLCGQTVRDFPKYSCRTYLTKLHELCAYSGKPLFSSAEISYPRVKVLTEKTLIPLYSEPGDTHKTAAPKMILSFFTFSYGKYLHNRELCEGEPKSAIEKYQIFDDLEALYNSVEDFEFVTQTAYSRRALTG